MARLELFLFVDGEEPLKLSDGGSVTPGLVIGRGGQR